MMRWGFEKREFRREMFPVEVRGMLVAIVGGRGGAQDGG